MKSNSYLDAFKKAGIPEIMQPKLLFVIVAKRFGTLYWLCPKYLMVFLGIMFASFPRGVWPYIVDWF